MIKKGHQLKTTLPRLIFTYVATQQTIQAILFNLDEPSEHFCGVRHAQAPDRIGCNPGCAVVRDGLGTSARGTARFKARLVSKRLSRERGLLHPLLCERPLCPATSRDLSLGLSHQRQLLFSQRCRLKSRDRQRRHLPLRLSRQWRLLLA